MSFWVLCRWVIKLTDWLFCVTLSTSDCIISGSPASFSHMHCVLFCWIFLPHAVNCVRFYFWRCDFLFVYEISWELLNGFAPNSRGRCGWSLAQTSLNVKVKGQGNRDNRRHFSALSEACLRFAFGKTSSVCSFLNALTVLVGWQEGHLACKKLVPQRFSSGANGGRKLRVNWLTQLHLVTFCVSRRWCKMCIGHTCLCVSDCLSAAAYHTTELTGM